jgi:hypothetical protein
MISDKRISEMQDYELIEVVQVASGLFGSYSPSSASLTSFSYILKQKFPYITGDKIIKLCTDVAANPPKTEIKFTPSFLATIIQSSERTLRPLTYAERETSTEERIKFRQQFLKDLYADFELHKHGKDMTNIIVWDYVARQLVNAGFAESLPQKENIQTRKKDTSNIRDVFTSHLPFVKECFSRMINNNQHISEIINGIV